MEIAKAAAFVIGMVWAAAGRAAPMTFEFTCTGNAVEACFVYASGEIGADTDAQFAAFLEAEPIEGNQIVLNSQGGNLGAGVRLGRLIRAADLTAIVGEPKRRADGGGIYPYEFPTAGTCASACAYAFLGGTTRVLREGSRLGFHRFYMGAQGASASAQQVSGQLVSYLVEMGVDPRIFAKASSEGADSMYWVDGNEAEDYDLITPYGYGDFFMEPYGKGVVAAAKRKTPPGPYDAVYQVTAYCRDGAPKLLFTATFAPDRSAGFGLELDGAVRDVSAERVATRMAGNTGYLEVVLSQRDADALARATSVRTGFDYSRAEGGGYGTLLELSDMDRKMLEAAFRLCL